MIFGLDLKDRKGGALGHAGRLGEGTGALKPSAYGQCYPPTQGVLFLVYRLRMLSQPAIWYIPV